RRNAVGADHPVDVGLSSTVQKESLQRVGEVPVGTIASEMTLELGEAGDAYRLISEAPFREPDEGGDRGCRTGDRGGRQTIDFEDVDADIQAHARLSFFPVLIGPAGCPLGPPGCRAAPRQDRPCSPRAAPGAGLSPCACRSAGR